MTNLIDNYRHFNYLLQSSAGAVGNKLKSLQGFNASINKIFF